MIQVKDYDFLKKFISVFLLVYFAAGLATKALPTEREKEIIPFYAWFLYVTVPNEMRTYVVRVYEYHGKVFDPPVLFEEAEVVKERRSGKARQLIQRLASSIMYGQAEQTEQLRRLFERAYLTSPARYEVGQLSYHPFKRWQGEAADFRGLKEFIATH